MADCAGHPRPTGCGRGRLPYVSGVAMTTRVGRRRASGRRSHLVLQAENDLQNLPTFAGSELARLASWCARWCVCLCGCMRVVCMARLLVCVLRCVCARLCLCVCLPLSACGVCALSNDSFPSTTAADARPWPRSGCRRPPVRTYLSAGCVCTAAPLWRGLGCGRGK